VATTAPLGPREGLTIAVGFPKGIVREPTRADRMGWLLYDNRGLLIVLAGLALVLLFYLWRWQRRGRDPRAGTVIPEYEPPAGHPRPGSGTCAACGTTTGASRRTWWRWAWRGTCGSTARDPGSGEKWRLERLAADIPGDAPASQRALHRKLFEKGAVLEMESGTPAGSPGRAPRTRRR
jgi:hypothetical protein